MNTTLLLFGLQFVGCLVAWLTVSAWLVAPAIRHLSRERRLAIWIAPHLFRVLGLGLLVPNLSPGLPIGFALSTAVGDGVTTLLALASILSLTRGWPRARVLVWTFSCVGSADLAVALAHAASTEASLYLHGQWYVAACGVPLMVVCHLRVWQTLLERAPSTEREGPRVDQ